MNSPLQRHAQSEQGFTLIELLVVILLIGILSALALPAFLGQQQKGQDGRAKHNARSLVSQIHACFQEEDGFVGCAALLTAGTTGLPVGIGPGTVRVTAESETGYVIEATSKARTGAANHLYTITFDQATGAVRRCLPVGAGGCQDDADGDGVGDW